MIIFKVKLIGNPIEIKDGLILKAYRSHFERYQYKELNALFGVN